MDNFIDDFYSVYNYGVCDSIFNDAYNWRNIGFTYSKLI
jgi:hypothetical protein